MIILQAPHEAIQVTTLLPNPQPGDTQNDIVTLIHKRSLTNKLYTYVRNKQRQRLAYKFVLTRPKALELEAFVNSFLTNNIRLTDYKKQLWVVNFTNDPFQYARIHREGITEVSLEFQGNQIIQTNTQSLIDSLTITHSAVKS